ncbi:F-box domain-containing protein [Mycena kentingensis (nom. inval.)]|nr:F-box domain-containing protein [Mycena kentingensis (nom. inval.)]
MFTPRIALPDEIIHEILAPALRVSDDAFAESGLRSPFAGLSESPAVYLSVCKSWMRVGTPLLYSVVVLRSKAQAKALAAVIAEHEELGAFIKKLRVEGGFGPSMLRILQAAPNVAHLFLSFEIWSPDNTESGLCKGLELINPTRLIIGRLSPNGPDNRQVRKLVDALCSAIKEDWNRLTVFDVPVPILVSESDPVPSIIDSISDAVAAAGRLESVVIPMAFSAKYVYDKFGTSCPLSAIQCKHWFPSIDDDLGLEPAIRALLKPFSPIRVPIPSPTVSESPSNPTYVPMEGVPQATQDAIWGRILSFAMYVPERARTPLPIGLYFDPVNILLVSKQFHTLALPHLYAHLFVYSSNAPDLELFLNRKLDIPVRSFYSAEAIPWAAYPGVAELYGSTLDTCWINSDAPKHIPREVLPMFTALRKLRWTGATELVGDLTAFPPDTLPLLEDLRIDYCSGALLELISSFSLNSLTAVHLVDCGSPSELMQFFDTHGPKLLDIQVSPGQLGADMRLLDRCPNLQSLTLRFKGNHMEPPSKTFFIAQEPIQSLKKLYFVVSGLGTDRFIATRQNSRNGSDKALISKWTSFFSTLSPSHALCPLPHIPNVRDVQISTLIWPTTEHEIRKSNWVRWAEKLQSNGENAVGLVDVTSKRWRPRLR